MRVSLFLFFMYLLNYIPQLNMGYRIQVWDIRLRTFGGTSSSQICNRALGSLSEVTHKLRQFSNPQTCILGLGNKDIFLCRMWVPHYCINCTSNAYLCTMSLGVPVQHITGLLLTHQFSNRGRSKHTIYLYSSVISTFIIIKKLSITNWKFEYIEPMFFFALSQTLVTVSLESLQKICFSLN